MAIEWGKLRTEYESDIVSVDELSKKYGCKAQTIERRAKKYGWVKRVRGETPSGLKQEGKERRRVSPLPSRSKPKESTRILGEHRRLWQSVKGTLVEGIAEGDEKRLKVAKIAGDGLLNIVKGERQAWGITEGSTDVSAEELLGVVKEMEEATVSRGAETALERE
ncbi:MAG: hypothetical protein KAS88_00350 [Deltaproteobacteria bacterium]|nr:hypothetical protein [Deltaproteobacteria bacterium]